MSDNVFESSRLRSSARRRLAGLAGIAGIAACAWSETGSWRAPGASPPRRVAVLPIAADLEDAATRSCRAGLARMGVEIVAPEVVAAAMVGHRCCNVPRADAMLIAKRVGADAIVTGYLTPHQFSTAADVELVRAETGAVVATAHWDPASGDACAALVAAPKH